MKTFKFTHWLKINEKEIESEELEQYRVIEGYLEDTSAKATAYMIGKQLFNRVISLECDDDFATIDNKLNSFGSSPQILVSAPENIDFLGEFEFAPFGDIEGWVIR